MTTAPMPSPDQPTAPRNGFGTTALVLGITGFLFSLIPLVGVIAWPLVILGLVFTFLGWQRTRSHEATNRGVVIAGGITSALGLVVCISYTMLFAAGFASTNSSTRSATIGQSSGGSTPTVTMQMPAPTLPPGSYGDGTYIVGSDLQPGTYTTPGAPHGDSCYWERKRDLNGTIHSIAANDLFHGPGVVSVQPDDAAVQFKDGCIWTKK